MREELVIERIRALCAARGWSVYRLAKASGIPYSTLNTMLNKANAPSFWTLSKICAGFDITMAQFFGETESEQILTKAQREHLAQWDALDEAGKALATAYIDGLLSRQTSK